jgi:hypothetical protein
MTNQTIYTVGGTVQAGGGIYIPRKADDELLAYCRASEFAFILSSRQVGKSSLMVRTAQQLEKEGVHSIVIDLSSMGVKISKNEWYLGILNEIADTLGLNVDIFSWWAEHAALSPSTRMINFFRELLLEQVTKPIVVFFDEIDSTLSIPFTDDFFIALRAIYNARSTVADFKRLSFVLIGVASPSDLISDSARTPFNIGHRVELTDFTLEELCPLAVGLGENAEQVLKWIFAWTNGHPYLTQRLCQFLTTSRDGITEEMVEKAVKDLFLGDKGMEDNNLQFVRDMLLKRAADKIGVLKTYQQVIIGKMPVEDDEQSLIKSHLKLSGVVRRRQENLYVSNLIYKQVFNLNWIEEHFPRIEQRTFSVVTKGQIVFTLFVLILLFGIFFGVAVWLKSLTPTTYYPIATLPVYDWSPQPQIPTETATSIPVSLSTLQAVTKEELSCYFLNDRGYNAVVYIPPFEVVMVVGQNLTGRWGLVNLTGLADCWVHLDLLDLKGDVYSLPVIVSDLPPMINHSTDEVATESQSTVSPIIIDWKVKSYYCNENRRVENVTVDLDISGGMAPYTTSPVVPITTSPGQTLSIRVTSNTPNGEPSRMISFVVPREDSFTCAKSGDNTDAPSDPIDPTPTDPDVCYSPQGHEIPCKEK